MARWIATMLLSTLMMPTAAMAWDWEPVEPEWHLINPMEMLDELDESEEQELRAKVGMEIDYASTEPASSVESTPVVPPPSKTPASSDSDGAADANLDSKRDRIEPAKASR